MNDRIKASCMAAVVSDGHRNHCVLISYAGGKIDDWCVWHDEIDNSIYIEDIFVGYDEPPNIPGFYVWEGDIRPVHDDQPEYYGKWRPATKDDMASLVDA